MESTRTRLNDRRPLFLAILCLSLTLVVGGKPLTILFHTLLLVLVCCWAWVNRAATYLAIYLEPERPVLTTGDRLALRVRLNNEGFLPVPCVTVDGSKGRPPLGEKIEGWVAPLGSAGVSIAPAPLPRGVYRLGPLAVEVRDPLGLFHVTGVAWGEKVTVYPRVLPLVAPTAAAGRSFGRLPTHHPSQEDFSNLAEIRAYRPGDNPRLIDWKATARQGSWQVKVLEERTQAEVWLFLDMERQPSQHGEETGESEELLVELAASLARHVLLHGQALALLAYARTPVEVGPGRGEGKWREVMQSLLRLRADGTVPLAQVLHAHAAALPHGSTVIALTPWMSLSLADQCIRLKRQGLIVIPVLLSPRGPDLADEGVAALLVAGGVNLFLAHLQAAPSLHWILA